MINNRSNNHEDRSASICDYFISIIETYFKNSQVTTDLKLLLNDHSWDRNRKRTIDKTTLIRVMQQLIEIDFNNRNNYYSHSTRTDVMKYTVILAELIKIVAPSTESNELRRH